MHEEIRDKARGLASNAKQQVGAQYEKQRDTATSELDSLAGALRNAGNELQGGLSGQVISRLADRVETFSRSLNGKDLDGIVDDVERFARRNPAVFLGTAVAAGFLVSRFLKSSGRRSMGGYDAYSSEAYGGFYDRGSDVAIGSNANTGFSGTAGAGHGAGGGIGTTGTTGTLDTPGITTAKES